LFAGEAGYTAADFAAHSLRSGLLTSAAAAGASIWKMREVSRHKSVQVLSDYVRNSDLLRDHAGKDFLRRSGAPEMSAEVSHQQLPVLTLTISHCHCEPLLRRGNPGAASAVLPALDCRVASTPRNDGNGQSKRPFVSP